MPEAWSPFQRAQFVEIARRCAVERCAAYTLVAVGMQSYVVAENAWPALAASAASAPELEPLSLLSLPAPAPPTADDDGAARSGHRE